MGASKTPTVEKQVVKRRSTAFMIHEHADGTVEVFQRGPGGSATADNAPRAISILTDQIASDLYE